MAGIDPSSRAATEPGWNRLLLAGFLVSVVILLGTAAISTWNHEQLVSTQRNVSKTQALLREIAELHENILKARDAQQGFVITGQEETLQPYRQATNRVAQTLVLLREHLLADALQRPRLERLLPLLEDVLSTFQEHIETRRQHGFDAAAQLAVTREVAARLDPLESILGEIAAEERRQLDERDAKSARVERMTFWFNNGGRVLTIVLFAGVFFSLLRENQLRQKSEIELRQAGLELERRVARRTAELKEKNKELETVVYVVSHDLRSPLLNVQGFARRLGETCRTLVQSLSSIPGGDARKADLRTAVDETIPQALGFIESGIRRMDQLLSGFLRYSRLGRVALNIVPLDMNELLAEVVQAMRFEIDRAGAVIQVDRLPRCLGDATHTTQVFANLLDNALKYRDPGRPLRVTVSGREDGETSLYSVADNGVGIAPEHQPKIFEIFHRLNPEQTPGEGLGLTITQRILERQNGRISVESRVGAGSSFFVALPRAGDAPAKDS